MIISYAKIDISQLVLDRLGSYLFLTPHNSLSLQLAQLLPKTPAYLPNSGVTI